jgi:hypothetical protein
VFTIGMGLLPYGFSVLLQSLRGVPPSEWQSSPELRFFSILVSAAQLDGVFAARDEPRNGTTAWPTLLGAMFGCSLVAAIVSAVLYGVYVDHARHDPARTVGSTCENGGAVHRRRSPPRRGEAPVRGVAGLSGESVYIVYLGGRRGGRGRHVHRVGPCTETAMNLFYEITFLVAKLTIGGLMLTTAWGIGLVLHERHAGGSAHGLKPERRVGPADRRATLRVP